MVPCGSLDQRRVHIPGMLVDSWHRKCRESTHIICIHMSYDGTWWHMKLDVFSKFTCKWGKSEVVYLGSLQAYFGVL